MRGDAGRAREWQASRHHSPSCCCRPAAGVLGTTSFPLFSFAVRLCGALVAPAAGRWRDRCPSRFWRRWRCCVCSPASRERWRPSAGPVVQALPSGHGLLECCSGCRRRRGRWRTRRCTRGTRSARGTDPSSWAPGMTRCWAANRVRARQKAHRRLRHHWTWQWCSSGSTGGESARTAWTPRDWRPY